MNSELTGILLALEAGDRRGSEQILPLVYDELRRLAARELARERPGQTLQPTALVHEAFLRLVDTDKVQNWDSRGHFFSAAAEAMRRILVEQARRKKRVKHGGQLNRVELTDPPEQGEVNQDDRMIEVDAALDALASEDPQAAEVVKLHFFAGLPLTEVAQALGLSRATAYRQWTYARSWLKAQIDRQT